MEEFKKKFPSFGKHFSIQQPLPNINGINEQTNLIQKVVVDMRENIENIITKEIIEAAAEQGITDLIVLDKKAIINALQKQIPKKPLNPCGRWGGKGKGGNCPICGAHTTNNVSNFCRKCGQALEW